MDALELIWLVAVLGLPAFTLAWFIFDRLFERGTLDRTANDQELEAGAKSYFKSKKETESSFFDRQITKLGGGAYGIAALWTLIVLEISDAIAFIAEFPGFSELLEQGIVSLVIRFLVNQLDAFITALLWFTWWPDSGIGIVVSFAIAWFAYMAALRVAKILRPREALARLRKVLDQKEDG